MRAVNRAIEEAIHRIRLNLNALLFPLENGTYECEAFVVVFDVAVVLRLRLCHCSAAYRCLVTRRRPRFEAEFIALCGACL